MMRKPLLAILVFCALIHAGSTIRAQETAFTYQGSLRDGAGPANGSYDLCFALYDAPGAGALQGSWLTNSPTTVSNGLFTVTLDFGRQFSGAGRWLEVLVRTNGGDVFTTLAPRQALTPAPYAIAAGSVTGPIEGSSIVSGSITSTQLAPGAVSTAHIPNGSVTAGHLAPGAAVGNLAASGQGAVPRGAMILLWSPPDDRRWTDAGYVPIRSLRTTGSVSTLYLWQKR
jgi:hypothetical protein